MSGPSDSMPTAKRRPGDQITKDNYDDDDDEESQEPMGTWKAADEETIKQRKKVKVKRGVAASSSTPTSANPFSGISLVPPSGASANPFAGISLQPPSAAPPAAESSAPADDEGKKEGASEAAAEEKPQAEAQTEAAATAGEGQETAPATAAVVSKEPASGSIFGASAAGGASPWGSVSSSGSAAFGGGSGFSGFKASGGGFGAFGGGTGGFGGFKAASVAPPDSSTGTAPSTGAFGFSPNGSFPLAAVTIPSSSVFGAPPSEGPVDAPAAAVPPPSNKKPGITGEEDEKTVFSSDCTLFEFDTEHAWKERGRGEVRVNVSAAGQARLVMRNKGNLRLLLNANLYPQMAVTTMLGGKGVTFSVINAAPGVNAEEKKAEAGAAGEEEEKKGEGEAGGDGVPKNGNVGEKAEHGEEEGEAKAPKLATYALRIKLPDRLQAFIEVVNTYKDSKPVGGATEGETGVAAAAGEAVAAAENAV